MHDPMTVVFEIKNPLVKPSQYGYRPSFITVWHVDPERDGTDDSCDWFGRHLSPDEHEAAMDLVANEIDNLNPYFKGWHEGDVESVLTAQWRKARKFYSPRPWWKHPRWHVHHWQLQIHPLQHLRRWLFSRCERCGQRFPWGYAPVSRNYVHRHWWQGESGLYHHDCENLHRSEAGEMREFIETLDL